MTSRSRWGHARSRCVAATAVAGLVGVMAPQADAGQLRPVAPSPVPGVHIDVDQVEEANGVTLAGERTYGRVVPRRTFVLAP